MLGPAGRTDGWFVNIRSTNQIPPCVKTNNSYVAGNSVCVTLTGKQVGYLDELLPFVWSSSSRNPDIYYYVIFTKMQHNVPTTTIKRTITVTTTTPYCHLHRHGDAGKVTPVYRVFRPWKIRNYSGLYLKY